MPVDVAVTQLQSPSQLALIAPPTPPPRSTHANHKELPGCLAGAQQAAVAAELGHVLARGPPPLSCGVGPPLDQPSHYHALVTRLPERTCSTHYDGSVQIKEGSIPGCCRPTEHWSIAFAYAILFADNGGGSW